MADHTNKSHTKGLSGEFLDNTVIWSESNPTGSDQVAISGANSLLAATANQSAIPMHVNNFLGVLGSSSTPIVPTDRFGEIVISIQWDQPYQCSEALLNQDLLLTLTTHMSFLTYIYRLKLYLSLMTRIIPASAIKI
jgi:hypothetical protein